MMKNIGFRVCVPGAIRLFKLLLRFEKTRQWVIETLSEWASLRGLRYHVAAEIQEAIACVTGYPVCLYCRWVVFPDQAHDFCQRQLSGEDLAEEEQIAAEIEGAWEERKREQQEEVEKAEREWWMAVCPCGHSRCRHQLGYGPCKDTRCGCNEFGQPVEDWETHREVNLGGSPGGFRIYE